MDKTIKLTFVNDHKCPVRKGNYTIASLVSYFKQENFDRVFKQLGFSTLPEPVLNILKKYGYKFDYSLNGWKTVTTGVVMLQANDTDNQEKANNMSFTKAKVKAFNKTQKCFNAIYELFDNVSLLFNSSSTAMEHNFIVETDALNRCLKTGYCDPKKH